MDSEIFSAAVSAYEARVSSEIGIYRDCTDVHDLPSIFHYWSNRYVRPMLERHGFADPAEMFLIALRRQCARHTGGTRAFLSVGSGNCDLEINLAVRLRAEGYGDFTIDCLDLNPAMLRRGAENANLRGVGANLQFAAADLNHWIAPREYDAVLADQSLHHILNLESLFGQIRQSLLPGGTFVISDMVGRNGHLRWPDALEIVREFWRKLPPSYRRNCRSGRYEAFFEDADCSTKSFEGIRAQDILPLLREYFHFEFLLGFGNLIDPFVDRSFGPHFDPGAEWDREFIDQVHRRDQEEFAAGRLKPTHMLAVLGKQPGAISPFTGPAVSPPGFETAYRVDTTAPPPVASGYEWGCWPHCTQQQLANICGALEDSENRSRDLEKQLEGAIGLAEQREIELQQRTAWALQLDRQRRDAYLAIAEHEEELLRRAVWARNLEARLAEHTSWALRLNDELEERTRWAVSLDSEVEVLREALQQPRRLSRRLHNAAKLALRFFPDRWPGSAARIP